MGGQDHQVVEHPCPVQVHNSGGWPPRLGLLRQVLAQQPEPDHRLRRVGQVRQGVEPDQLQVEDHPHRPHRLPQHRPMSPDGSLCASGGKDAKAMLWDLNDGKHLYPLDHADTINALCFSPNRYWLCAATGPSIKIWDLESKNMVEELRPEVPGNSSRADPPQCLSMAWSSDGQTLFAGYSDNLIRVWQVSVSTR